MKKAMKITIKLLIALFFLGAFAVIIFDAVTGQRLLDSMQGWWTLFLIIPGFLGLFHRGSRLSSFGLMLFGGMMLVRENAEGWLAAYPDVAARVADIKWWTLALAVVLLLIALAVLGSIFGIRRHVSVNVNTNTGKSSTVKKNGKEYSAVFSEVKKSYDGELFTGAEVSGIFSTAELDLTGAIIESNCEIEANAVFGSVVIRTAPDVNVEVNGSQVFGSVSNVDRAHIAGAYTIKVNANAVFGGVEVK